jgi:multidrug efflux system membrane fusion protein
MKRLTLVFFTLFLLSCNRETANLEKSPTPVRLSAVETYKPSQGQRYSASVLPNRQVNLAFRVNGFVESIYQVRGADGKLRSVDIGDVVKAGTVLASVRSKDYELQVSQAQGQLKQATQTEQAARAQLAQAEAAAAKADQDFQRASSLFKETSLTKSDYDSAKANYDSTRAQVEAAKSQVQASSGTVNTTQAALGTASLGLHDSSLTTPFTGVIVQRSIELGTLAGPGTLAFVVADISSVKATFAVPDIVIGHVRNGSKLAIYAEPFPNRQFRGYVSAVAAVADSTTRSFQVEITVSNERALLKPGMIVSVDLGEAPRSQPVMVVPLDAIVRGTAESSQFAVMVVNDGVAKLRPVTLGPTYGDRIVISGVAAGERVIRSGANLVSDGATVKVIP